MSTKSAKLAIASAVTMALAARNTFGGRSFNFDLEGAIDAPPSGNPTAIKALREEFAAKHAESQSIIDAAVAANRELTADEQKANDQRFARLEQIKKVIDEQSRFAGLAIAGETKPAGGRLDLGNEPPGKGEFGGRPLAMKDEAFLREFNAGLNQWAVSGEMPRKFATIITTTQSSALLPRTIAEPEVLTVGNVFREALAVWGVKPIYTKTTEVINYPIMDVAAGAAVAENASSETTNDTSLANTIVLTPTTYQSGTGYFSNLLLNANSFDLVNYIQTDLVDSKEEGFEAAIAAAIIADAGITQVVTSATTTGFTYDNLVDLTQKLSKKWNKQTFILLGQAAYSAAIKLVGSDGHPILIPDVQNGALMRFLGIPVLRCDNLEALTANKTVGLIISLKGFKIRDCADQSLMRYTQVPAKPNQTGFNLFGYHAHGYAVAAIAKLKTAVS